ncbi:hypothetical protein H0H93_013508 [Arthromyces matolae]|nr:hypothetical protein H0H93_013508 [Arthromyces matolae]
MPNFPCPQCDATFTRTDALRRHQKSRHQGVVLGPAEKDGDDDGSSGSQSKSRSATPSLKGKEKANDSASHPFPNSTRNGSSYYRQHTLMTGRKLAQSFHFKYAHTALLAYVPPRQIVMNPQYTNVDLPTSAPRSNADATWGYPNPWPDGVSIHQMSYQHVYYTSHYRTNVSSEESVPISPSTAPPSNSAAQHPTTIPPPPHPSQDIHKNSTTNPDNNSENATTNTTYDDSHLSHSNESTDLTAEQILQLTKITKAFFDDRECPSTKGRVRSTSTINGQDERGIGKNDHHSHGHLLERAQSMEHMLTEDGEPMLNPGS